MCPNYSVSLNNNNFVIWGLINRNFSTSSIGVEINEVIVTYCSLCSRTSHCSGRRWILAAWPSAPLFPAWPATKRGKQILVSSQNTNKDEKWARNQQRGLVCDFATMCEWERWWLSYRVCCTANAPSSPDAYYALDGSREVSVHNTSITTYISTALMEKGNILLSYYFCDCS